MSHSAARARTGRDRTSLYQEITDKIIAQLEAGRVPWVQPWGTTAAKAPLAMPKNASTGRSYSGINVLILWGSVIEHGFPVQGWLTFRQALSLGGNVRKGEKGSPVVYADTMRRTETDDATGDETERAIPFLKAYTVFNVEQIEGLPEHFHALAHASRNPDERIAGAETFFAATRADIRHGGDCAYYSPALDYIQMPPFEAFGNAEGYYATLSHECTHWTGDAKRLDRTFGKKFGDDNYAREELVAELGSAFLCASLELTPETREDHASYLAHWLKVLKEDKRAIFQAAAHAQRAADFLNALQPKTDAEEAKAA